MHRVTIKSPDGTLLDLDEDSRFLAGLNVDFSWDQEDRAWLYNSDAGGVWCWERAGDGWRKAKAADPSMIPKWILPEDARQEKRKWRRA